MREEEVVIGMEVKLTADEYLYSDDQMLADMLDLKDFKKNRQFSDYQLKDDRVFTLVSLGTHPGHDCLLVGIRDEFHGQDFVIDVRGVEKTERPKLKLGQRVLVVDKCQVFPSHSQMADKLGLTNWKRDLRLPKSGENNTLFKVVGLNDDSWDMVGIEDVAQGNQFLIQPTGLKLVTPKFIDHHLVGEMVTSISWKYVYSHYQYMAETLGLKNWVKGRSLSETGDKAYYVESAVQHMGSEDATILVIMDIENGDEFLVGPWGVDYTTPNNKSTDAISASENKKENTTMKSKLFETKNYVLGNDVKNCSDEDLINAIRQAEADIKSLEALGVESKNIKKQVATLKDQLALVVKELDAPHRVK